jgi:hypothetical protein
MSLGQGQCCQSERKTYSRKRKEEAMANQDVELNEADFAKFQTHLEEWSETLDPKEKILLGILMRSSIAADPEVAGFLDGEIKLDPNQLTMDIKAAVSKIPAKYLPSNFVINPPPAPKK